MSGGHGELFTGPGWGHELPVRICRLEYVAGAEHSMFPVYAACIIGQCFLLLPHSSLSIGRAV